MSMSIARAKYTGDPGLFDFFKKAATVATSFIPFVGPQVSQFIGSIGRQPAIPVAGPGSVPLTDIQRHAAHGHPFANPTHLKAYPLGGPINGATFPTPLPGVVPMFQRAFTGGATGMTPGSAAPMNGTAGGYHLNKSSYFLLSGEFVAAGTRWVKNRKRNPANARATSRAISRVVGAKKYATTLGRISIRKKC